MNRILIAVIRLSRECEDSVEWFVANRQRGIVRIAESGGRKRDGCPVILVVLGHGVIVRTFEEDDGRLEQIRKGAEFLWEEEKAENGIRLAFVRKERMEHVREELRKMGIEGFAAYVGKGNPEEEAFRVAALFYKKHGSWKAFIKDDRLAGMLADRWKWSILAGLFLLLTGNYMAGSYLRGWRMRLQAELSVQENVRKNREDSFRQAGRLMTDYDGVKKYPYSLLLDRIGRGVPAHTTLTRLEVMPLSGRIESGKELRIRKDCAWIEGETDRTVEVTFFLSDLAREKLIHQVRLISLEQDRRSGKFKFCLELQI